MTTQHLHLADTTTPEPGETLDSLTQMAAELIEEIDDTVTTLRETLTKISVLSRQPTNSAQLLSLKEVELALGVSRSTVHRLTHPTPDGKDPVLPTVPIRGVRKVSRADLDAYLRSA